MRIELRNDSVMIDGYVNAVCRESKPVITKYGKVNEVIEQRAFEKALSRAENVDLLLNHNNDKNLGSTKQGNLKLWEDNIGLRAIATITDPEVIEEARANKLVGWSFGMYAKEDSLEERADKLPLRKVSDMDLFEVSIIDTKMNPCYSATSIETRAGVDQEIEIRATETKTLVENMVETPQETIDYTEFENRLKKQ